MDPAMFLALRLSKEGFGAPGAILRTPVNEVLAMLHFSNFSGDYLDTVEVLERDANRR